MQALSKIGQRHFYYMNTLDGLHPDEDGMRIIAEVVIEAIEGHGLLK